MEGAFIAILGVVMGAIISEVIRRRARTETLALRLHDARLKAYGEIFPALVDAIRSGDMETLNAKSSIYAPILSDKVSLGIAIVLTVHGGYIRLSEYRQAVPPDWVEAINEAYKGGMGDHLREAQLLVLFPKLLNAMREDLGVAPLDKKLQEIFGGITKKG